MEQRLYEEIVNFIGTHVGNRLPGSTSPYFDQPLVGISSACDPLYQEYKQIIGLFHLTPQELLSGAHSVVSWILPIAVEVRESNRQQSEWPSRQWAATRFNGEALNGELRRHLVAWLENTGYQAVAPQYSPLWQEYTDTAVGIASTWSERHAAYVAGLGTFSLSDGFITARGIAHRCGSVITTAPLTPTPRTAPSHLHNCLHYNSATCGVCISRCPVGAISRVGHDKQRCRQLVYGSAPAKLSVEYGVAQTGCGLCQTKVPCEATIPRVVALPGAGR